MTAVATFTASGIAVHAKAERILGQLCAHLGEHLTVTRTDWGARLETVIGSVDLTLSSAQLKIEMACPTASMLFTIRSMVAEHLFLFAADEPLDLSWADGPQPSRIPDLREVSVVGARNITPKMRRVTVACDDVAHFSDGGLHVRLLIPPKDRMPIWPQTGIDGRIHWPRGEDALIVRAYTIRNIDLSHGQMDIDFVVHDGESVPGASWALGARPGDRAGLIGPGGGGVPQSRNLVLAGDETALPAIARIAAAMPADARLQILLEVENAEEEQPLFTAAKHEITWFYRMGRPAGTTGTLEGAVREIVTRSDPSTYIWTACEQSEARAIRNFMKTDIQFDRTRFSVAAYWQR